MISKVLEMMDDKSFYNKWVKMIDKSYTQSAYYIDETYFVKDDLSPEMAQIYLTSLMDYYSKLRHLHASYVTEKIHLTEEQNKYNFNIIRQEVYDLLDKYRDFVFLLLSIKDIEVYKDVAVPNEFLTLNDYI